MPDRLLSECGIKAGMNLSFDVPNGTVSLDDGTGQRILFYPDGDKIFLGKVEGVYLIALAQIIAISNGLNVQPLPEQGSRFKRFLFVEP